MEAKGLDRPPERIKKDVKPNNTYTIRTRIATDGSSINFSSTKAAKIPSYLHPHCVARASTVSVSEETKDKHEKEQRNERPGKQHHQLREAKEQVATNCHLDSNSRRAFQQR